MREILFRGKRADNWQWVNGFYAHELQGGHFISADEGAWYDGPMLSYVEVIPETVGQYTGLDDKNDVKIFEGDVVRYLNSIESGNGVVIFDACAFLFNWIDSDETDSLLRHFQCSEELEVIGNVHDNSELMEVGNDH